MLHEESILVTYTLFPHVYPKEKVVREDVPWEDLTGRIKNAATYINKTDCPLISMAEYGDTIDRDHKCLRYAENVQRVYGVELDYDGEQVPIEEAAQLLQKANLRSILYTSPSHTAAKPRWRALLPLCEPALPEKRGEYVGRANRALGGIASRESFTLSQSFYIGRVRGASYEVLETEGRCIDNASDLLPQYYAGHANGGAPRDQTTDADLRAAFERGENRYQAMLKLSSRWAARGMSGDDIEESLLQMLGAGSHNGDGIDLRSRARPMADSAVRKFGETRRPADEPIPPAQTPPPPAEPAPKGRPIILRAIHEIVAESREAEWLIHKVIEQNVLAVIAGPRGTFKSFVALDWSMRMALDGHPGVILSGEGGGLDRRISAWSQIHRPDIDLTAVPLVALERPLNLSLLAELGALSAAIELLPSSPDFIVIDTLSKFSTGMDENDNGEMAMFLSNLSACLREDLGCTVLLVAHSGHGEAQRPRGASALMSNPDAEYIVSRPDPRGMTVAVSRERFKDTAALPPLAYEAKVVDLGRVDRYGEPVTSLALVTSDTPPPPNMKGRGRNQEKVLVALREWYRTQPGATHITSIDIRELCKAQGVGHKRQPEVLTAFVNSRILSPSVGGYVFHGENL